WLAVGWFWFLGTLVPVIGLVQVGRQAMADRYAYIPLISIFIAIAWGLGELAARLKQTRAASAIACMALAACMALTWTQVGYWKDSETLFQHDIEVAGDNFLACYNLSTFYVAINRPDDVMSYVERARKASPESEERLKSPASF